MTNLMRISNSFNMWYGFTTCLSDIYQTEEQKNNAAMAEQNIIDDFGKLL